MTKYYRAFYFFLVLATATYSSADLKRPDDLTPGEGVRRQYAPQVDAIGVRIERGAKSEFMIDAVSSNPGKLLFLIRSKPVVGVLEGPFNVEGEPHKAKFRYLAPQDTRFDSVEFDYAVRIPGGAISSSAKVTLYLTNPEMKLRTTARSNVGEVIVGNTVEGSVFIKNEGSAEWRGTVSVSRSEFSVPNDFLKIKIPSGQGLNIPVVFTPNQAGKLKGELVLFDGKNKSYAGIEGEGLAPFTFDSGVLDLEFTEDASRVGSVTISSRIPTKQTLLFEPQPPLVLSQRTVELEPDQKMELEVKMPNTEQGEYKGKVVVSSDVFINTLFVKAVSRPSDIRIKTYGDIDFGTVELGNYGFQALVIKNQGGETESVRVSCLPPFYIDGDKKVFDAKGGHEIRVKVKMNAEHSGIFRRMLQVEYADVTKEFPMKVDVVDPREKLKPVVTLNPSWSWKLSEFEVSDEAENNEKVPVNKRVDFTKLSKGQLDRILLDVVRGRSVGRTYYSDQISSASKPRLREAGKDFLEIEFDLPKQIPAGFVLEQASLRRSPEEGLIIKEWSPCPKTTPIVRESERRVVARFDDLESGRGYEFRVVCLSEGNETSFPSEIGSFTTLPEKYIPWGWPLLVLLVAVIGFLFWKKQRAVYEV